MIGDNPQLSDRLDHDGLRVPNRSDTVLVPSKVCIDVGTLQRAMVRRRLVSRTAKDAAGRQRAGILPPQ